jgi:hypothetical protein
MQAGGDIKHRHRILYQRLLGAEFDTLPPVLRRFYSLPDGGRAAGIVAVLK